VKSDDELVEDVTNELFFDPRIDHIDAIAVGADDGTVTLRGTVGSFHEKHNAGSAAKRVRGVTDVRNELNVRLMTDARATTPTSAPPRCRCSCSTASSPPSRSTSRSQMPS